MKNTFQRFIVTPAKIITIPDMNFNSFPEKMGSYTLLLPNNVNEPWLYMKDLFKTDKIWRKDANTLMRWAPKKETLHIMRNRLDISMNWCTR